MSSTSKSGLLTGRVRIVTRFAIARPRIRGTQTSRNDIKISPLTHQIQIILNRCQIKVSLHSRSREDFFTVAVDEVGKFAPDPTLIYDTSAKTYNRIQGAAHMLETHWLTSRSASLYSKSAQKPTARFTGYVHVSITNSTTKISQTSPFERGTTKQPLKPAYGALSTKKESSGQKSPESGKIRSHPILSMYFLEKIIDKTRLQTCNTTRIMPTLMSWYQTAHVRIARMTRDSETFSSGADVWHIFLTFCEGYARHQNPLYRQKNEIAQSKLV